MKCEDAWRALEAEPAGVDPRNIQRRLFGESAVDLFAGLRLPEKSRWLRLEVAAAAGEDFEDIPAARSIDHTVTTYGTRTSFTLELTDRAATDIFEALANDIAGSAAKEKDDRAAVANWNSRLSRWQRLLQRSPTGLSPERQRGLYGELWTVRNLLCPEFPTGQVVAAWSGPEGGHHDFQFQKGSLEVKTCAANQPQVVTINGERQLDETGTESLHLIYLSLEINRNSGETLLDIVGECRELANAAGVQTLYDECLFAAGFVPSHSARYSRVGYTLRENRIFRVGSGFPKIVEKDLPEGVGRLRYALTISACLPFEVPKAEFTTMVAGE